MITNKIDNFFKPRKRKNNVITIADGKVNSGSVQKKGKYSPGNSDLFASAKKCQCKTAFLVFTSAKC